MSEVKYIKEKIVKPYREDIKLLIKENTEIPLI
jgi:hypothetical protein